VILNHERLDLGADQVGRGCHVCPPGEHLPRQYHFSLCGYFHTVIHPIPGQPRLMYSGMRRTLNKAEESGRKWREIIRPVILGSGHRSTTMSADIHLLPDRLLTLMRVRREKGQCPENPQSPA
jgi:hypothetical protein